ncbi:MAG: hypothetical protein JW750_09155 [Anaerolineaceae bacterium]|nr:hypothetical protein [Anaerolineaceae bacterium]
MMSGYSPTNQYIEFFIQGCVEVLGEETIQVLCDERAADSMRLDDLAEIHRRLLSSFGQRAADGIEFRAGRSAFQNYIQQHAADVGFFKNDFRLRPVAGRMRQGLRMVSDSLSDLLSAETSVNETEYDYRVAFGGISKDEQMFLSGFVQEFFFWVSNGKLFPLRPGEPDAEHSVVICVNKIPFDL